MPQAVLQVWEAPTNYRHLCFRIGAGISGAGIAHFLLHNHDFSGSVALFEAREVSSGASKLVVLLTSCILLSLDRLLAGRNGGFIKPVPFKAYPGYKKDHGMERALELVQSEYDNLGLTEELVKVRCRPCVLIKRRL